MVRKKVETKWIAEIPEGKRTFTTRGEAVQAEIDYTYKCEERRLKELFVKYFPPRHKDSYRFKTYCVDCGELLYEYEAVWDGHRNEMGDFHKVQDFSAFLSGHRCEECDEKAWELFDEMKEAYLRDAKIKVYIEGRACIDLNQASDEMRIEVYKIVEHWDRLNDK